MIQLLISVKDVAEAITALDSGVDIIDLKDPNVGALGALDMALTRQIVKAANGRATISATVGEQHANLEALEHEILLRKQAGVDIVKIALNDWQDNSEFWIIMRALTGAGVRLVAVIFANLNVDLNIISHIKNAGFEGAMLDIQDKRLRLPEICDDKVLRAFVNQCEKMGLRSGLAGSLGIQDIDILCRVKPKYIGFRGGVCQNQARKNALSPPRLFEVVNLLHKHNKVFEKPVKTSLVALHS